MLQRRLKSSFGPGSRLDQRRERRSAARRQANFGPQFRRTMQHSSICMRLEAKAEADFRLHPRGSRAAFGIPANSSEELWDCAERLNERYGAMRALVWVNRKFDRAFTANENNRSATWFAIAHRLADMAISEIA